MDMSQQDYDARKQRIEGGTATDEDRRLVKQYEKEGYTWGGTRTAGSSEETPKTPSGDAAGPSSTAPTTANPSNKDATRASGTARSAGSSSTGKANH
jgi:hypothetical protein